MFLDIYYKDLGKTEKITINDFIHKNYRKDDKIRLELEYYYYYLFEILNNPEFGELYESGVRGDKSKIGASGILENLIDIYFKSNDEDLQYLKYLIKKSPKYLEGLIEENGLFFDAENSYIIVKLKNYGYLRFNRSKFYKFFDLPQSFQINISSFLKHLNIK